MGAEKPWPSIQVHPNCIPEQRDYRDQLGDVWFLLSTLLGHCGAEVTKSVYLEPFQGLQIEQLIALMDVDDRDALERLAETLRAGHPRVLTAVGV